ncbi:hypothetical protein BDN72DRAFT_859414 [Pluteus cervinus]|uniref:Uncharacterized protein n=1 Tax=Pluteus cervinus TaxID=181527 RepID=A0ACD3AMA5_9AGAR|nr:hypothetical protein BDN72DRAFT_859414 [Pluteus cervinus]
MNDTVIVHIVNTSKTKIQDVNFDVDNVKAKKDPQPGRQHIKAKIQAIDQDFNINAAKIHDVDNVKAKIQDLAFDNRGKDVKGIYLSVFPSLSAIVLCTLLGFFYEYFQRKGSVIVIQIHLFRQIIDTKTLRSTMAELPYSSLSTSERDARYPAFREIADHPLVSKEENSAIKRIILCEIDTSDSAMKDFYAFEEGLKVPLGPSVEMASKGLIKLMVGDIIILHKKGCEDQKDDVVGMWVGRAREDHAALLLRARELILGPKAERTLTRPVLEHLGNWVGGTAFERLQQGQPGVKGSRAYSHSIVHQCWRSMVGPTAGGKDLDREHPSDNIKLRRELVEIYTTVAMDIHDSFAPSVEKHILEETARVHNTPRVGCPKNVVTPSLQINIAPAVEEALCKTQGLEDLGEFGSIDGHRDLNDTAGALTTMIVNSDIPTTYERGRFHILGLGVYVDLEHQQSMVVLYSTLEELEHPKLVYQGYPL